MDRKEVVQLVSEFIDRLLQCGQNYLFEMRILTRRLSETLKNRLKYNDSSVDPVSDEDMEKLFSGNVKKQKQASTSNSSSSPEETNNVHISGDDKMDISALTSILDRHAATPYVYLYRRLDT